MRAMLYPPVRRYLAVVLGVLVWVVPGATLAVRPVPLKDQARASAEAPALFSPADFQRHVDYLASDELQGRGLGTEGIEQAARYIAAEFREAGLKPAGDEGPFLQGFQVTLGQKLTGPSELAVYGVEISGTLGDDYVPLPFSTGERFEGPLAFAGYGITNSEAGYDDYADFDAEGKVLLVLRYEPNDADPKAKFGGKEPSLFATFERKASLARRKGAKALLIVNPPLHRGQEDRLFDFESIGQVQSFGLPMLHVTREFAGRLLAVAGEPDLETLQRSLDERRRSRSTDLKGLVVHGTPGVVRERTTTHNVVGLLPGSGPQANEYVVIGAHYDHLGITVPRGALHGATRPGETAKPAIYNGADDNASGTSGLIELAKAFAREKQRNRSILFIAFSAEETGLLGSDHFVNHATVPLERIVAMLNMDMIGRLRDDRLQVFGTQTATDFETLVQREADELGFDLRTSAGGFGPSDHTSFYKKKIPVLHFFTGIHNDYHRPSDMPATINAEGGARVTELVYRVASAIAQAADRPQYVAIAERGSPRSGLKVRLGVMPAYAEDDEPGMGIDGVSPGSAAERAGLKEGDRILMIGEHTVNDVHDLMEVMAEFKPGDEADLTVVRAARQIKLAVRFEAP